MPGRHPADRLGQWLESLVQLENLMPRADRSDIAIGRKHSMSKFLVAVAAVGLIFLLLVSVVAPATPEGSFLNDFGKEVRDSMAAWFGNPV